MAVLSVKSRRRHRERNTFNLPQGDRIRRELRAWFKAQRRAVVSYLKTGRIATKDESGGDLPQNIPAWDSFGLGDLPMAERMAPLLESIWDDAGQAFTAKLGLDPDSWSVVNPHTQEAINQASLDFCESTNATTHLELDTALQKTREALSEGLITRGDSVADLTRRVNEIFSGAETWRARRIAASEASRATHAAQEMAAAASGVVTGWKWLLSEDACPLCQTVARRVPAVKLGQPFAIIGDNPKYSTIKFPPLHPGCCLPETPIVAPGRIAGIVAQYDGPVVRLAFSDGSEFAVTPNHMLLTVEGFAPASALVEGDDVIRYRVGQGLGAPDNHDQPAPIKDVVRSLAESGCVASGSVPAAPEYLHGDAALCQGDIHIVTPNRLLWHAHEPESVQMFAEGSLSFPHAQDSSLSRKSNLASVLFGLRDATDGGVGWRRERKAVALGHARVAKSLSTGIRADGETECENPSSDSRSRDAYCLRDCLLRFPEFVTTAKVIKVDRESHYRGPVYDVQTLTSLYLLGNGIASSNCQCSVVEVLDIDQQPQWSQTLVDPTPEEQDYAEGEAPQPKRPKPAAVERPKPLPKKKPKAVSYSEPGEPPDREAMNAAAVAMQERWKEQAGPLSSDQVSAIRAYKGTRYGAINHALRTPGAAVPPEVPLIDSAMAPLDEPTVVYRGVRRLRFTDSQGNASQLRGKRAVGLTMDELAYMSTSLSYGQARSFASDSGAIIRITAPEGTGYMTPDALERVPFDQAGEKEILLRRGIRLRITRYAGKVESDHVYEAAIEPE